MPYPTATVFLPYHALDDVVLRGTRAAQPAASAVVPGALYSVTDEGPRLERSNGTAWELAAATGEGTATVFSYRFSTQLVAPPGTAQIRFNAAHPYTGVTTIWVPPVTAGGVDAYWGLMLTRVGADLVVQDETDHTEYGRFETTAAPIDHGSYIELPVVWRSNGVALANNAAVLFRAGTPSGSTASWQDIAYVPARVIIDGGAQLTGVTMPLNRWRTIGSNLIVWQVTMNPATLPAISGSVYLTHLPFTIGSIYLAMPVTWAPAPGKIQRVDAFGVPAVQITRLDGANWAAGAWWAYWDVVAEIVP